MISGISSRLFQPYICTAPGSIRGIPESSPFLKLPDIPSRHYADLRNHPDFQAIKSQFLSDINEMDKLARKFVGNTYRGAIQTFRNNINVPPENIESGLFAIFDETRYQIHKIVARMKALSSEEPASSADSTPERDRVTLALHICLNEIDHCPAGVQSRFSRASQSLEAEPEQLNARLFLIRKTLLEEFSHTFLRLAIRNGVINIQSGDEIHWVNALFNSVCGQFGLDTIADPIATRQIKLDVMARFCSELPQVLNEYTILHTLACEYYQRFCHFLDKKNLSSWRTETVPAGKLTSDHMNDLEQAVLTPMNLLCNVQDREKAIKLSTLIEDDGDQYSFARCREKIQGWLTRTIMDVPATLFTRIPGPPDRQRYIGTYNNLFFWVFETVCLPETGTVCPFDAEESKPLTVSDLSTIDVFSWPEPVQLALLGQAMEQTGITPENARLIATFLLGNDSGKAVANYPISVQNVVASQLTEKMAANPAFAAKTTIEFCQSFTGVIPGWVMKTPLLEPLLLSQWVEGQQICSTTCKLDLWQLMAFSPQSLRILFTPEKCRELFLLALDQELGGLMWRLLQTGHCDVMNNYANSKTHSVLMVLCGQGFADSVAYLLTTLQDTAANSKNSNGHTALHFSARYGHAECLKKLLAVDNIILNARDNKEWTALHFAAKYGHIDCLNKLMAKDDIAFNEKTDTGWTALHLASRYGHILCLQKLLARNNIALNTETSDRWTALHLAVRFNHIACLEQLLTKGGIDLNGIGNNDFTALHFAAGNGHTECLRKLLDINNIALNGVDYLGWTALHHAASNGYTECLRELLQKQSIRVNTRNQSGFTPLMEAAALGHARCVELLLSRNDIEINITSEDGHNACTIARINHHQNIADMLAKHSPFNQ